MREVLFGGFSDCCVGGAIAFTPQYRSITSVYFKSVAGIVQRISLDLHFDHFHAERLAESSLDKAMVHSDFCFWPRYQKGSIVLVVVA